MCGHDEALPSGDKDARRLVRLNAGKKYFDGVRQAGEVRETLSGVKGQDLRVLQREGHWQRRGWGDLLKKNKTFIISIFIRKKLEMQKTKKIQMTFPHFRK